MKLTFKNKSVFDIVTPIGSTRGGRRNAGILDEFRDHNADDINEIVIPLLNVNRVTAQGDVNPNEPQQCQIWISSASDKNSFCYDKTIELLETAIINPQLCFVMGCDVSVPESVGLISKKFVDELKASPTFNEQGFAKEYLSRFVGSSEESWFDYDKFAIHRKLLNPETHNKLKAGDGCFYIISVDVRATKTVKLLQLY